MTYFLKRNRLIERYCLLPSIYQYYKCWIGFDDKFLGFFFFFFHNWRPSCLKRLFVSLYQQFTLCDAMNKIINTNYKKSVVAQWWAHWPLELKVPGSIPGLCKGIFGVQTRFHSCHLQVCRPSDRDVNWRPPVQGKSHPVQVKEPYGNSKWLLVGLPGVYNVHLPRMSARAHDSM